MYILKVASLGTSDTWEVSIDLVILFCGKHFNRGHVSHSIFNHNRVTGLYIDPLLQLQHILFTGTGTETERHGPSLDPLTY